jgi:WD40 repeat protein
VFNSILTGSYDGIARLWNFDGEMLADTAQYPGHSGQPIKCVAWLYDGKDYFQLFLCHVTLEACTEFHYAAAYLVNFTQGSERFTLKQNYNYLGFAKLAFLL